MNAKLMNQDQVETMLNHKAPEAMLDQHTFRQGMANLGAAVNVITTDGGQVRQALRHRQYVV